MTIARSNILSRNLPIPTTEKVTYASVTMSGCVNYDVLDQQFLWALGNTSANWGLNFRGRAGVSLNSIMRAGQALTCVVVVNNGGTAYFNSSVLIDSTAVSVCWVGGTAPSQGDTNSKNLWSYTVIKVSDAVFQTIGQQLKL